MQTNFKRMKKLLIQIIKFVGISGVGWVLDFCTYMALSKLLLCDLTTSNFISSWVGVTFVFFFATKKVFQQSGKVSIRIKYLIYLAYQCVLIFLISKLLAVINNAILIYCRVDLILHFSSVIAKIAVTPITMCLNYLVMKKLIEKL